MTLDDLHRTPDELERRARERGEDEDELPGDVLADPDTAVDPDLEGDLHVARELDKD